MFNSNDELQYIQEELYLLPPKFVSSGDLLHSFCFRHSHNISLSLTAGHALNLPTTDKSTSDEQKSYSDVTGADDASDTTSGPSM